MKLHFRYFLYQQKRIFQYIPQMIAGAIVLAVLAGTIAFCAVSKLSETSESTKVPVALVIESDSKTTQLALDIISEMESVKQHFDFLEMSEEDALHALDTGDVCAVMMLPKNVISGIMTALIIMYPFCCQIRMYYLQFFFRSLSFPAQRYYLPHRQAHIL